MHTSKMAGCCVYQCIKRKQPYWALFSGPVIKLLEEYMNIIMVIEACLSFNDLSFIPV